MTPDITHALENLVENAAEHNPSDDAEVRVTLKNDADSVVILIEDTGPSIPDNEVRVLERGYEDVLSHVSGVGLWIVPMVVDEIDGRIQYDSDDGGPRLFSRSRTDTRVLRGIEKSLALQRGEDVTAIQGEI